MTNSYSLGFTPFATPLRAKTFQLEDNGSCEGTRHYQVAQSGSYWVVGFRQKRGCLLLVTPEAQDLPWAENEHLESFLEEFVQTNGWINPTSPGCHSKSKAILWDSETEAQWNQIDKNRLFVHDPSQW